MGRSGRKKIRKEKGKKEGMYLEKVGKFRGSNEIIFFVFVDFRVICSWVII